MKFWEEQRLPRVVVLYVDGAGERERTREIIISFARGMGIRRESLGNPRVHRRAARAFREAIALRPNKPDAYGNLGAALQNSAHYVEAAQRYLEAKERYPVGSVYWAQTTAHAVGMLMQEACAEVAKPEWWNDEGLKALSARVVRAAPDDADARKMRAVVLSGQCDAWEAGPRSAAEVREAAAHFERAAALHTAPTFKANFAGAAEFCRSQAEAM